MALANYRAKRTAYYVAAMLEDAAFAANYASAELHCAQGELYKHDLDPWDVDDADRVERTPVGH